jgi:hypothetical protein
MLLETLILLSGLLAMGIEAAFVPTDGGGGLIRDRAKWSQGQGDFYRPFSLDKLALYGTLGALTAGVGSSAVITVRVRDWYWPLALVTLFASSPVGVGNDE